MLAEDNKTNEIDQKFLTFALEDEEYGVPVLQVVGIVQIEELISVPHAIPYLAGLMDVRGQVIPLVDLKIKLKLDLKEPKKGDRAIIVDIHNNRVALMVDSVFQVNNFPAESIDAGPPSIQDESGKFVLGIGKRVDSFVVLINLEQLFEDEELTRLSASNII